MNTYTAGREQSATSRHRLNMGRRNIKSWVGETRIIVTIVPELLTAVKFDFTTQPIRINGFH
jgi:hypothetical protein